MASGDVGVNLSKAGQRKNIDEGAALGRFEIVVTKFRASSPSCCCSDFARLLRSSLVALALPSCRRRARLNCTSRAGVGVVYVSNPYAEAQETRRKASALLGILAATEARS